MRPLRLRITHILFVSMAALLLPASALAFPLSNCTLNLTSRDGSGATIDTATSGGADSTQTDPFIVDWDGTVDWNGTMGSLVIMNHNWNVDVFGIPTPLRGGDPNTAGNTTGSDTAGVSANAPFRFTGLFYVSGQISGDGGSCSGSGWLRLRGDPVGTVPFFVGLALVLLGAALLAVGARGRWLAAVFGGLLLGLGAAVLLVIFALLPLAAPTPLVVLAAGLLIGILLGWFGRGRTPATA